MSEELIALRNCRIQNKIKTFFPELSWEFKKGESWLVIGPNGGGKADFVKALAGQLSFVPISGSDDDYKNCFDCHILPDLILIYSITEIDITLIRLFNHSELLKK